MRPGTFLPLAAALLAGGCANTGKCPKPVTYTQAQYTEIGEALKALPKDSILRQVLEDYETERDELRFCK